MPFPAFSRLLALYLLLSGALTASPLSEKTSPELVEKVDQPWKITLLQRSGGLENRALFFLDFEKNGTAWIATSGGLVRYDGFQWKEYGQNDGLPSNFVRCVLVANDGKIWVGTDQGAAVFDGKTFTAVGSEGGLAGPSVRRIAQDPDGALWFCSDRWPQAGVTSGLSRYYQGRWSTYREKDGLPNDYVANYFRDSLGRQFVMTLTGLAFGQPQQWTYPLGRQQKMEINWTSSSIVETAATGVAISNGTDVFFLKNNAWRKADVRVPHPYAMAATRDGRLIVSASTGSSKHGFFEWNGKDFVTASASFPSPANGFIDQVREAPDGALWRGRFRLPGSVGTRWNRMG